MQQFEWSVSSTAADQRKPIAVQVQDLLDRSMEDGLEVFAIVPAVGSVLVVRRRPKRITNVPTPTTA